MDGEVARAHRLYREAIEHLPFSAQISTIKHHNVDDAPYMFWKFVYTGTLKQSHRTACGAGKIRGYVGEKDKQLEGALTLRLCLAKVNPERFLSTAERR